MKDRPTLAVVTPTLEEEEQIGDLLDTLADQTEPADRVVVADAGSKDATSQIARRHGAECFVAERRGRGRQVSEAVARLDERIVLVAHADMRFPAGALERVRDAMSGPASPPGGCLGHRFDRRGFALGWVEVWDYWRARFGGMSYGDQAQFFDRERLLANGGFPDLPMMEDVALSDCLRALGKPAYLDLPVTVSSRRFDRLGYFRTVWINLRLRHAYRRHGIAACEEIYRIYYQRWIAEEPASQQSRRS